MLDRAARHAARTRRAQPRPGRGSAPSPAALHAQAFGVTRALQGLPALPGVADELCAIVRGPVKGLEDPASACAGQDRGPLPGNAQLNQGFTEMQLVEASRQQPGGLLHLGTHFVLCSGNVSRSWLLLGGPHLVVLSARETAVAVAADGREIDGLATALLDGGAQAVLASLWRVDDAETARFMRRFYAALAAQQGRAAGPKRGAGGRGAGPCLGGIRADAQPASLTSTARHHAPRPDNRARRPSWRKGHLSSKPCTLSAPSS